MTDYRPLLSRAIGALDPNTGEARRAVYDRARTALVNQLRGMNPPLAEADITRERLALEEAIRKIEGDVSASPPPPRPQPAPPRAPAASAAGGDDGRAVNDLTRPEADPFEPDAPPPGPQRRDAREPRVGNGRPDPRAQAYPPRESGLRPRPGRGKSPAEYAREDARRATRTKLVVAGIVGVLFLLALAVGYVHRERIVSLVGLGGPKQELPTKAPDRLKQDDRVQQQTQQQQAPQPLPPTTQPTGASQRALLFEENPGSQQFTTLNGTATWRTETVNPGPGRSPELGVRIDIDIPDRKMQAIVTIRRNPDQSLPASHYIEIQFTGNDAFGGIAQVPAVRMKNNEAAQGVPLAGLSVRVMQGFFLIGLSAIETDRERNVQLLRSQQWMDIPFVYNNGRRAVLAFEKGGAGEKAMAEAFAAWGG
jgi:hypothetical protein